MNKLKIGKKTEKVKKERNLSLFWTITGFFFAACFLIVGCTLTGVYYKNFYAYSKLLGAWAGGPGFADYVKAHNTNVSSYASTDGTEWVYASYSLFALGVSFILIGGLSIIGLSVFTNRMNLKKKSSKINQHDSSQLEVIDKKTSKKELAKKSLIKIKK